jgi:hypothetical protein
MHYAMREIHERYLKNPVIEDLKDKMVFIGGPWQVGKTTFALSFLSEPTEKHPACLNWDNTTTRSSLLRGELPAKEKCIVLDEIHKLARWRNLVKGILRRAGLGFYLFRYFARRSTYPKRAPMVGSFGKLSRPYCFAAAKQGAGSSRCQLRFSCPI